MKNERDRTNNEKERTKSTRGGGNTKYPKIQTIAKTPNLTEFLNFFRFFSFLGLILVFSCFARSSSLFLALPRSCSLLLALARSLLLALARSSSLFLALPRSSSLFPGLVVLFFSVSRSVLFIFVFGGSFFLCFAHFLCFSLFFTCFRSV